MPPNSVGRLSSLAAIRELTAAVDLRPRVNEPRSRARRWRFRSLDARRVCSSISRSRCPYGLFVPDVP
jgi:hypothetical protein